MKITKRDLYKLIDGTLESFEDWGCCLSSRKKQCTLIKKEIQKISIKKG